MREKIRFWGAGNKELFMKDSLNLRGKPNQVPLKNQADMVKLANRYKALVRSCAIACNKNRKDFKTISEKRIAAAGHEKKRLEDQAEMETLKKRFECQGVEMEALKKRLGGHDAEVKALKKRLENQEAEVCR